VLLWLYHRRPAVYRPLRTALVAATAVALACYLALPTAPPRFVPGYADILHRTADVGWWPASAGAGSVPTNELAAFPSMHAGWALWVGIALLVATRSLVPKVLAVVYALAVTAVVVLTANHWVLDVVAGWVAVALPAAWLLRRAVSLPMQPAHAAPDPTQVPVS
jgi:membrane-associated phospholipid phosphatase